MAEVPAGDWRDFGRDAARTHFSPLTQITRENVRNLKPAWTYHTGNSSNELATTIENNPLVVNGVMYVTSPVLEVIALDGATGRQIWKYNPFPERPDYGKAYQALAILLVCTAAFVSLVAYFVRRRKKKLVHSQATHQMAAVVFLFAFLEAAPSRHQLSQGLVNRAVHHFLPDPKKEQKRLGPNRGLTYWEDGADKRILFAGGHKLVALNAASGTPVDSFGEHGVVDLTAGLGRSIGSLVFTVTSPGVLYKDTIVIGSMVTEGPEPALPGHVLAYSVRTGKEKWIFHTIPQPGEYGYDTWPADAWKRSGGSNAWGGMSVDEARGLVFVPTGSATFDFYGGDRIGDNLFSDSLIALKAETGERVWHYQMIHHDLWDYDLACPPTLATLKRNGKMVDAVIQPTKGGFIFALNRDTGEPLFPVEERPVPASKLPGEKTSPTQPFPLKPAPLARLEITEADLTDLTPEAHAEALKIFRRVTGAAIFAPPSKEGTIVTPGLHGGPNWSGSSFDPRTNRLYINTNEIPFLLEITDARPGSGFPYSIRGFFRFMDSNGYPAIKPPWGKLSAVDMNSGDLLWQVPLGEYKELTARGIAPTGTENGGGSVLSASGVLFIAATKDKMFRAFDSDNGQILWQTELHAAGHSIPTTYAINGRQYVVIAAGGGSMVASASGDEYIAYALPQTP